MKTKAIIFFFFLGLTLFYFLDFLLLKKTLLILHHGSDFLANEHPLRFTALSFLKKGIFPLWNPFIMCGTPFLASSLSVLSIFNIPGLFFPTIPAYMFSIMIQLFCAGIFMFYYLNKGLKIGINPSLLGGVIFMFSPLFLFSLPHHSGESAALLWLPLALLFYELALQKKDIIYTLFAALTLTVSLYSAVGYIYLYSCLFLFLYGLGHIWKSRENKKDALHILYFLVMTILISALLSCARILPTMELMKLSHRGNDYPKEGFFISNLIGIFFPFGPIQIGQAEIGTLQNVYLYYAGTATIFLVIIALFYIRREYFVRLFLLLLSGLIIFLVLLTYTPLKLYLSKIFPLFGTLSLERLFYYYHFLVAGIAALGYEAIEKNRIKDGYFLFIEKFVKLLIIAYVILLALVIFIWIGKNIFKDQLISIFQTAFNYLLLGKGPYTHNVDYYLKKFSFMYEQIFLPSFAALIVIGILSRILSLIFLPKIFRNIKKASLVFILLVSLDLIFVTRLFTNPFSYDYYNVYESKSKEVAFLKTVKPTERIGIKINYYTRDLDKVDFKSDYNKEVVDLGLYRLGLNWDIPIVFGASLVGGHDAMHSKRFREFVDLIHRNDPNYAIRCQALRSRHVVEFTSIDSRLVDLLGMKYMFSISPLANPKLKLLFKGSDYYAYENLKVFPRSFFVNSIKVASSKEELFGILGDPKFDPSKEVVLEEPFAPVWDNFNRDNLSNYSSVEITSYQPNQVIITASNDRDSLLLLTDSYYPGWKAFVDNRQTKIYVADYIFRAVLFPKGTHRVEFIYDPFSFRLGILIFLATLLILISVGILYNVVTVYRRKVKKLIINK